jgi:hypothetical protein
MAEVRTYDLDTITRCMGPAYAVAVKEPTPERAMRIFTDAVIQALKDLPEVSPGKAMADAIARELAQQGE